MLEDRQLSQWKGACVLLNMKDALSGLIQVNDDQEEKVDKQGETVVASSRYRRYPIQAYK